MPHFQLQDLLKWLHFVCLATGGGAAVVALLLSGLEDEQQEFRGLASVLWKKVVAWSFRMALISGGALLAVKTGLGASPFASMGFRLKLLLVIPLLAAAETSAGPLGKGKRGAPLIAVLMFLLVTFVAINASAFGYTVTPAVPAQVSAAPAP